MSPFSNPNQPANQGAQRVYAPFGRWAMFFAGILLAGVLVGAFLLVESQVERQKEHQAAIEEICATLYSAYLNEGELKSRPQLERMATRYIQDYGTAAPAAARRAGIAIAAMAVSGGNSFDIADRVGLACEEERLTDLAAGRLDPFSIVPKR
jgi:hypothetical protein